MHVTVNSGMIIPSKVSRPGQGHIPGRNAIALDRPGHSQYQSSGEVQVTEELAFRKAEGTRHHSVLLSLLRAIFSNRGPETTGIRRI